MKDIKEITLYIIFGILTTAVNIAVFFLLYDVVHSGLIIANITAWLLSVSFAYITNRIFVFKVKSGDVLKEMVMFFAARIFSLVIDTGIIYIGIDIMHLDALAVKIFSNIIVIILNYALSKFIIFKAK